MMKSCVVCKMFLWLVLTAILTTWIVSFISWNNWACLPIFGLMATGYFCGFYYMHADTEEFAFNLIMGFLLLFALVFITWIVYFQTLHDPLIFVPVLLLFCVNISFGVCAK